MVSSGRISPRCNSLLQSSALSTGRRRSAFLFTFVLMAVGSAFFQIRPFTSPRDRFIGNSDQADVAMVARNIAEGKGAVVDCVWLLHEGGLPGNDVTHPEAYWSIYVAAIWAPFFKLFGATRQTIMLVSSLVKTGIAALACYWTIRLTKSYLAATATAAYLLLRCYVPVSGLSDIYLTFFILVAVTTAIIAWHKRSTLGLFAAGIFSGLAIGAKPSGLLLVVLFPMLALLREDRWRCCKTLWAVALGAVVAVAPLCLHNYWGHGTLYWPALPLVSAESSTPSDVGMLRSAKRFVERTLEGQLIPTWMLPFLAYAFCSTAYLYYRRRGRCSSVAFNLVATTALLGCAGICQAIFVRVEWRYWNFIVPLATVTAIVTCARLSPIFVWFALGWSVIVGIDRHWELQSVPLRPVPEEYTIVGKVLPKDAIVMTQRPWEFAFHTRTKTVILPSRSDATVIRSVADRYRVEYLAIIKREYPHLRHKDLEPLTAGVFPSWLDPVYQDAKLVIGRFRHP